MVIEKAASPATPSKVDSYSCGTAAQTAAVQANIAASNTLLMTWYSSSGYGGSSTTVYGHDGACDQSGYGIGAVGAGNPGWNDHIQSWKVYNKCYYSADFQNNNYGGDCDVYQNNVSKRDSFDTFGISSFWVSNGQYAWGICLN